MPDYPQYRNCSCSQWTQHAASCPQNPQIIKAVRQAAQLVLRPKDPPKLHREEATLSESNTSTDVKAGCAQCHLDKKAGCDDWGNHIPSVTG